MLQAASVQMPLQLLWQLMLRNQFRNVDFVTPQTLTNTALVLTALDTSCTALQSIDTGGEWLQPWALAASHKTLS